MTHLAQDLGTQVPAASDMMDPDMTDLHMTDLDRTDLDRTDLDRTDLDRTDLDMTVPAPLARARRPFSPSTMHAVTDESEWSLVGDPT